MYKIIFCIVIALTLIGCNHDPHRNSRGEASNPDNCYTNGSLVNPDDWVRHEPTGNIGKVYSASSRKLIDGEWRDRITVEVHDGTAYVGCILYKSVELVKIKKPDSIKSNERVEIPFKP